MMTDRIDSRTPPGSPQHGPHPREQRRGPERLREVLIGVKQDAADVVARSRDDEDRHLLGFLPDLSAGILPAELGHCGIEAMRVFVMGS